MNRKREMRISIVETPKQAMSVVTGLDPSCQSKSNMRSRIEQLEYAKVRGWFSAREAADYLGLSPKTLYNLKSKGQIKSNGQRRKLIFELSELNRFLTGAKI